MMTGRLVDSVDWILHGEDDGDMALQVALVVLALGETSAGKKTSHFRTVIT